MTERAYTYIDAGTAIIGNRWCERRWSAFMGHSTEVLCLESQLDWMASTNTEFYLLFRDRRLGVMELGKISWSEEATPHNMVLERRKGNGEIVLVTRNTVFHESPGILRNSYLVNVSDKPMEFLGAVTDTVFPKDDALRAEVLHYNPRMNTGHALAGLHISDPPPMLVSLWRRNSGLIIGTEGPGAFLAQTEEQGEIAMGAYCPATLFPGGILPLPESYIIPFRGADESARKRAQQHFMHVRRTWMHWDVERNQA